MWALQTLRKMAHLLKRTAVSTAKYKANNSYNHRASHFSWYHVLAAVLLAFGTFSCSWHLLAAAVTPQLKIHQRNIENIFLSPTLTHARPNRGDIPNTMCEKNTLEAHSEAPVQNNYIKVLQYIFHDFTYTQRKPALADNVFREFEYFTSIEKFPIHLIFALMQRNRRSEGQMTTLSSLW